MVKVREMLNGIFRGRTSGVEDRNGIDVMKQIDVEQKALMEDIAKENQIILSEGRETTREEINKIMSQFGHKTPVQIFKEHGKLIFTIAQKFCYLLEKNEKLFLEEYKDIKLETNKIRDLGGKVNPLVELSQEHYMKEVAPRISNLKKYWSSIKQHGDIFLNTPNYSLNNTTLIKQMKPLNDAIATLGKANERILNR